MGKMIKFTTVALMLLLSYGAIGNQAQADETPSATLYLSPSSTSVKQGESIKLTIRESSGEEPVVGIQANLTYPAELFEFVSVDYSESAFTIPAESKAGEGSIKIGRAQWPPTPGDNIVASFTLKAKTNNGTASVSFTEDSKIISGKSATNIMSSSNGGTYVLTSASPPPKPVQAAPAPKPVPKKAPEPTVIASANNERVTLSVTTPNTERRNEQNQVGFWVPLLVLVATMLASTMAASGFSMKGIRRHFMFILPPDNKHKYPHL